MALTKAEMAERLYEELGLNKREAKELVEAIPSTVKEGVEKDEAEKLVAQLEAAGATAEIK